MKKNYITLSLMVVFLVSIESFAKNIFSPEPVAIEDTTLQTSEETCRCYCSDVCGPRDAKEDDTPFFDEEYGLCFCKPRDKENYIKNGCHLTVREEFRSCCSPKEGVSIDY